MHEYIYTFNIILDLSRNIKTPLRILRHALREMNLTVTISILIVNNVYNGIMFMKRGILVNSRQ